MCNTNRFIKKNLIFMLLFILPKSNFSQDCNFIGVPRNELDKNDEHQVTSGDYYKIIYEYKDNPLTAMVFNFDHKNPSSTTPCVFVDLYFKSTLENEVRYRFKSKYPKYNEKTDCYSSSETNTNYNCMAFPLEKSGNDKNYFIIRVTKYMYLSYISE